MKTIRKIRLWMIVTFNDWPCYRVTYSDGTRTYPLHYAEAKGLVDCFDGKMSIDYEYANKLIFQS